MGDAAVLLALFGARDQHLRRICDSIRVGISARNGSVHIEGDEREVARATEVFERMKAVLGRNDVLGADQVTEILAQVMGAENGVPSSAIRLGAAGRTVRPRSAGQSRYVKGIREHDLVFCIGPAGTGKTYLAVATAVEALTERRIRKIVLVRPAVEAGESLGYLPGDLQAKINPYLRPLLDALREMIDYDQVKRCMEEDVIEVIPLAYMRGRTLNNAFIILDEAQNTTVAQMKMFLTRMGVDSRVVVSGDVTQVDLPPHTRCGLVDAIARLKGVRGFFQVTLTGADIVRHRLVQDIVNAYERGPRRKQ